jgi:uncharacterized repeat protein (TIGR03803 family)
MGKIKGQRSAPVSPAIELQTLPAPAAAVHNGKKNIIRTLCVPWVIVLVLAGQTFNASAQMETNLYSFGNPPDGHDPRAGLVQGSDGNFYGTTYSGGTSNAGTVFRIGSGGSYSNLYSFDGSPNDGANSAASLVQGGDGNFYGTTYYGGTSNAGTVFWINPGGSETNLHSFLGPPTDGVNPIAGLVRGSDGNFYGTTVAGGTSNAGTVFRISPGGSYSNLYSFAGSPNDGDAPTAGLVQGSDGNFYGTTSMGGTSNVGNVFRINPGGSETNLYSFGSSPEDGLAPLAGLVQGSDGNFYGTTYAGGTSNLGTVFRISPGGSYTNLYSFLGPPTDGAYAAELVQGSDGNFYGTTEYGGTNNSGTVFRISPGGSYSNLYSFQGYPNDGTNLSAGLVQGSDGKFYGVAQEGGTNNRGIVFKLMFPLNPPPYPINYITAVHVAATNIVFNVASIAGETYQLQFTTNLTSGIWSNVSGLSVTNSIGALLTLTNSGGAVGPQGFYRFAIIP